MCFPLNWILQICIWMIVVGAVLLILQLVIPYALAKAGLGVGEGLNLIIRVVKIVLGAIVGILVLIVCFELIACLIGYAGGGASLLPHR